jgi:peptidyl-prolyl cis-trans isomerase D
MLQAIRSKAASFLVKILFGVLILMFGYWGIADIFRTSGPDMSVAHVGGRVITMDQASQAVQSEIERLRNLFGGTVDPQQAKQLGIVDQAMQQLVAENLVELEINRMGLQIGDDAVRDAILTNPAFRNQQGVFDRNIYEQVLLANHMTEQQFEAETREELLKAQLTAALVSGVTPPKKLVDTLYRSRAERRTALMVTLPPDAAGNIPMPTDAQLDEYYRAHPQSFQSPERRTFKVAMLRLDDVAAGITVSDDQLKAAYEQRQDEFNTPEERHVLQMLLPDEATAKVAQAQLGLGKDFAAVAKDVAKMDDPTSLDLGWVKRTDLPPELAGPAFDAQENVPTAPIKSSFGWHILRVTGIKPGVTKTFDQVKDQVRTEVAKDQASDRMADIANNIDDALAGGGSFDAVAQKFALKITSADAVDNAGKDASGAAPPLGKEAEAILKTAFSTNEGQTSQLTEMGDDGYFIVQVAKVMPAATRPLADVRGDVAAAWQADARQQALQKAADAMVAEVNGGKSLKEVAAERRLDATETPPLQRTGGSDTVPPSLVAKLFDAKEGAAVTEAGDGGIIVAQLEKIEPADPAQDKAAVQQLAQQLGESLQGDTVAEYDQALRRTFPVTIDQDRVDQLMQ